MNPPRSTIDIAKSVIRVDEAAPALGISQPDHDPIPEQAPIRLCLPRRWSARWLAREGGVIADD